MNYELLEDAQLWQLIASNDRGAFGHSFKLYAKDIFKYGQKFTGRCHSGCLSGTMG